MGDIFAWAARTTVPEVEAFEQAGVPVNEFTVAGGCAARSMSSAPGSGRRWRFDGGSV
ncbi:hypothetical protein ACEZDB_03010 [Streptacidiphilus sp. N1-3]|uniref:Uncharacterized protein n=1 Tax=Streptacidiphilus alkalitolerans TaxID=3342712 RepID=A0ABV6WUA1_9ACTN